MKSPANYEQGGARYTQKLSTGPWEVWGTEWYGNWYLEWGPLSYANSHSLRTCSSKPVYRFSCKSNLTSFREPPETFDNNICNARDSCLRSSRLSVIPAAPEWPDKLCRPENAGLASGKGYASRHFILRNLTPSSNSTRERLVLSILFVLSGDSWTSTAFSIGKFNHVSHYIYRKSFVATSIYRRRQFEKFRFQKLLIKVQHLYGPTI